MNDEKWLTLMRQYEQSKDVLIRDELFEGYLPLARAVARKFYGRGVEMEDLEQVASMALLKAIERFDSARGFRFTTYAVPTITGDVRNYLRDKSQLLRMPREMQQRLYQMTKEQERFESAHFRAPTAKELSELMGISPDELLSLLQMRKQNEIVSMDIPVGEESDGTLASMLGKADDAFERAEQSDWMQWVLSKVSEKERALLLYRFVDGISQRDTAKKLGVSQMQISRMERRALSRLRAIEAGSLA